MPSTGLQYRLPPSDLPRAGHRAENRRESKEAGGCVDLGKLSLVVATTATAVVVVLAASRGRKRSGGETIAAADARWINVFMVTLPSLEQANSCTI